ADYGEIEVQTEPAGAIVYLDNDEKGIAPLILQDVIKGEHELSVYSPSFFRRSQKINIDAGYRVISEFKLAIDPSQKKIEIKDEPEEPKQSSPEATQKRASVTILNTPTGFLRVRSDPNINATEVSRVNPNDTFLIISEQPNWYQIEYAKDQTGWIAAQYARKIEE
ncbi:MAG TPA: SH3 domain-containing protein, partial [Candidatus Nitrosocosmicus sp.]|nr:SH3 domain-containing protein [Candidatus Nitrosocosmicus sp.]